MYFQFDSYRNRQIRAQLNVYVVRLQAQRLVDGKAADLEQPPLLVYSSVYSA